MKKIRSYAAASINKKTTLVFILVFTGISVLDLTIVDFSTYSGVGIPTSLNITIFVVFFVIFAAGSIILVSSVGHTIIPYGSKQGLPVSLGFFHLSISVTIVLMIAITLIIILQMILVNQYNLLLLTALSYLSHLSAFIFISLIVIMFVRWVVSVKRNHVIILYIITFSLVSSNLIVSLVYLNYYLTVPGATRTDIRAYPLTRYLIDFPGTIFTASLSVIFDMLSALSFLFMWIATAILLGQYKIRMGSIKYYALMSVPLIYYIFPLQGYFGDVFFSMLLASPIAIALVYVLFFSATKQVGAFVFSLSFWTASSLIHDDRIRKSLLMSSIGMSIVFGFHAVSPLQYHTYPPYGLITELFLPLGAYLLFIGIFTSAKHISGDARVRKMFYESAATQLSLLRTIGVSEMEKQYESKVKSVEKHVQSLPEIKQMSEEDIRATLHDVLNELYSKEAAKDRHISS